MNEIFFRKAERIVLEIAKKTIDKLPHAIQIFYFQSLIKRLERYETPVTGSKKNSALPLSSTLETQSIEYEVNTAEQEAVIVRLQSAMREALKDLRLHIVLQALLTYKINVSDKYVDFNTFRLTTIQVPLPVNGTEVTIFDGKISIKEELLISGKGKYFGVLKLEIKDIMGALEIVSSLDVIEVVSKGSTRLPFYENTSHSPSSIEAISENMITLLALELLEKIKSNN